MSKFCSECGSGNIEHKVPEGDQHRRAVCGNCGVIHYVNPKVVAGCLLTWEGKILLAKRSIEPRKGYWTLPAGFMELKESTAEAAARECWEEALATPENMSLMGITSLPHIGQVYAMYRGTLKNGEFGVGEESAEVALFAPEDIPWKQLSFPVVHSTLKRYIRGDDNVFDEVIDRQTDWLTKGD
ncbi:MAG: NUDIX hydrolase [Lysobacterales bacterium]